MGINDIPLLTRDDIIRRINHMKGEPYVTRPDEVTMRDMARWIGVKLETIKLHLRGREPITDSWQITYSWFFHLIDTGQLKLRVTVDPEDRRRRRKELVRVPKPESPPKRPIRPHIDFSANPALRFT